MLSAHALRFARRIHAVARRLPHCATPEAALHVHNETRLLHARMHSPLVSMIVLSLALTVIVFLCA
ncbi:MAG: hypothetical protein ACK4UY_16095, partial [Dietzia sp.]